MSETVEAYYSEVEFQDLLDVAQNNAQTAFEVDFVEGVQAKWEKYGMQAYLSERQRDLLERLSRRDQDEGRRI